MEVYCLRKSRERKLSLSFMRAFISSYSMPHKFATTKHASKTGTLLTSRLGEAGASNVTLHVPYSLPL
eukprot:scaffold282641_cov14-Tisochrysis_lutea.AAC.1